MSVIIIVIIVVIIIIIIVIIFFYFLSKCSRNALDCFYSCVCVCARNNIEETKKIDSVYVYILLFFFFSLSLRFVTTGLVYLSAILVCRFCCLSPVFSIVSRSRLRRRLLSAEKHNGEQLLWRIVIFSTLFTQRVKVATNEQSFPFKRSIHRRQLFLKAIKSISGYYWMKLMKLCLVVSLKCELIEDYY